MQKNRVYDTAFFKRAGKRGAKKRNEKHNASEITKRGWETRRRNLTK